MIALEAKIHLKGEQKFHTIVAVAMNHAALVAAFNGLADAIMLPKNAAFCCMELHVRAVSPSEAASLTDNVTH